MALVPFQQISEGVADVKLEVIEGRLEKLEIHGLKTLDEETIRQQILASVDMPLNIPKLQKALAKLQTHPQIQKVESELVNGAKEGDAVLIVHVTEMPSVELTKVPFSLKKTF